MSPAILAAEFHPPTTKDFVFGCYFSFHVGGIEFCFNFVILLLAIALVAALAFFYVGLRRPQVVPGRLQSLVEMGLGFVREQIAMPMLGPASDRYLPLLVTLFFLILFMNILEVTPGLNLAPSSRVAFPLVLAAISWVTYNAVGVARHGFLGYLRFTCIIPAAPWWLRYTLLPLIEFASNIVIRPITLTIRLTANFLAGHFLLALAFVGTEFFLLNGPKTYVLLGVSVPLSIILVAFEVFVAILQAFIFAVLTASYIGGAMAEEH